MNGCSFAYVHLHCLIVWKKISVYEDIKMFNLSYHVSACAVWLFSRFVQFCISTKYSNSGCMYNKKMHQILTGSFPVLTPFSLWILLGSSNLKNWTADPVGPVQNIFFPILHNFKLMAPIVQQAGPTGSQGPQSLYACLWLRPRNSPLPPAFGLIYEDTICHLRWHLFVTLWSFLSTSVQKLKLNFYLFVRVNACD